MSNKSYIAYLGSAMGVPETNSPRITGIVASKAVQPDREESICFHEIIYICGRDGRQTAYEIGPIDHPGAFFEEKVLPMFSGTVSYPVLTKLKDILSQIFLHSRNFEDVARDFIENKKSLKHEFDKEALLEQIKRALEYVVEVEPQKFVNLLFDKAFDVEGKNMAGETIGKINLEEGLADLMNAEIIHMIPSDKEVETEWKNYRGVSGLIQMDEDERSRALADDFQFLDSGFEAGGSDHKPD